MNNYITKENIEFLINSKLKEIKRENVISIGYDDVEKALFSLKWKDGVPEHLNIIAQDIHDITVDEIIDVMTVNNR